MKAQRKNRRYCSMRCRERAYRGKGTARYEKRLAKLRAKRQGVARV
jgi:hypothetical protein